MDPTFSLSGADADVVFHALRYYAADVCEAFLEDDESPLLDDAAAAEDIARRLQVWLVANHQTLMRSAS